MRFLFLGFDKILKKKSENFWNFVIADEKNAVVQFEKSCDDISRKFWFFELEFCDFVRIWVYKVFRLHVFE